MKKHKGSKSRKLFKKGNTASLGLNVETLTDEQNQGPTQADSSPVIPEDSHVDSVLEFTDEHNADTKEIKEEGSVSQTSFRSGEISDRIEFETNEPVKTTEKFHKVNSQDPWQEAFADENTVLIKRTVRSGQCIRFDGNVVVLGDVNPGAEIVASGNIVVMGALRGVIHAGATGNEDATVAAFKLQPTQLRIANHITRAPDGDYLAPNHPEIARIRDGVVVIEMYQLNQDRQTKIC